MIAVVICIIVVFVLGYFLGMAEGVNKCSRILLNTPKVREVLGDDKWGELMRRLA